MDFQMYKKNNKIKVRVIGQRFELNDSHISIIAEFLEISKIARTNNRIRYNNTGRYELS